MTEIPPETIESLGTLEARRTEDSTTPNASETMGPVAPVHWRGSMLIHLVDIRQLKSQMWSLMPLFLQIWSPQQWVELHQQLLFGTQLVRSVKLSSPVPAQWEWGRLFDGSTRFFYENGCNSGT